ncbi:hypothetical protein QAD02_006316, partial [Eretmocerus hayati]
MESFKTKLILVMTLCVFLTNQTASAWFLSALFDTGPVPERKCLKQNGIAEDAVDKFIEEDADGFARLDIGEDKNFCMYACYIKDDLKSSLDDYLSQVPTGKEMKKSCKTE